MAAGVRLSDLPCVRTRVEPFGHLLFVWTAFGELSTDRQLGMTRGPIPWISLHFYAERFGVVGDEFSRFMELIRAMDAAYLGYFKKDD